MLGACPRCQARLDLPASGLYSCERCRRAFHVYLCAPTRAASAAPTGGTASTSVPPSAGDARCARHANNAAVGTCERCGDFMCSLCATPAEGRAYCARCFELLHQRGSFSFLQRGFDLPRTALILSIVSWFTCWLGLVTSPAAIATGIAALRRIARQPELPGKGQAYAAIAIAATYVLAITIFIVYQIRVSSR